MRCGTICRKFPIFFSSNKCFQWKCIYVCGPFISLTINHFKCCRSTSFKVISYVDDFAYTTQQNIYFTFICTYCSENTALNCRMKRNWVHNIYVVFTIWFWQLVFFYSVSSSQCTYVSLFFFRHVIDITTR